MSRRSFLNEPDKGIGQAENILARLFRMILKDIGMNDTWWRALMLLYLNNPRKVAHGGNSVRGNLNKELEKRRITFDVFMKGIRFLSPVSARLEIHLTWPTKKITKHGINIDVGYSASESIYGDVEMGEDVDDTDLEAEERSLPPSAETARSNSEELRRTILERSQALKSETGKVPTRRIVK